jgi:hypothetical protein
MLIRYSDRPYTSAPSGDRWAPRVAPVVLGALLVALAVSSNVMGAPGVPPATSGRAGCANVSPGAVNLWGALEGQPPISGRDVRACR